MQHNALTTKRPSSIRQTLLTSWEIRNVQECSTLLEFLVYYRAYFIIVQCSSCERFCVPRPRSSPHEHGNSASPHSTKHLEADLFAGGLSCFAAYRVELLGLSCEAETVRAAMGWGCLQWFQRCNSNNFVSSHSLVHANLIRCRYWHISSVSI